MSKGLLSLAPQILMQLLLLTGLLAINAKTGLTA